MAVERAAGGTSLIDVLDRVLDKGIVIDAWVRVSLVGIDLITVEARVVVASIDTYLKYSEAVGQVAPVSRPQAELTAHQNVIAENAALRAELAATKSAGARGNWRPRRAHGRAEDESLGRVTSARGRRAGRPASRPASWKRSSGLAEFLLASTDLQVSARRAVDWLVAQTPHQTRRRRFSQIPRHISWSSSPSTASRARRSPNSSSPVTTKRIP